MVNTNSKSGKLLQAFKKGEKLTVAQIKQRFSIANPTATVSDLRYSGYAIYANQHKDVKGRKVTKYEIGMPSRRVVAAGYLAISMGLA